MQAYTESVKCRICEVPLAGREQFVGHMIHGHDMPFEAADAMWKRACASHNIH